MALIILFTLEECLSGMMYPLDYEIILKLRVFSQEANKFSRSS